MSRRSSRGSRLYQQESIKEKDEEEECPVEEDDQFQGEYEPEAERALNGSGRRSPERKSRTTAGTTYTPDEGQSLHLVSPNGYQGISSPRESNASRAERLYQEENVSGRRTQEHSQHFDVPPDYQPSGSPRSVSPHHTSFHERNEYSSRSFREQRAEEVEECEEEPPPRAVSPLYRQSMLPREEQFVEGAPSSPYGTRTRVTYENVPTDPTGSTVSPFHDSTMYREISPFSAPSRDQSSRRSSPRASPRRGPISPENLDPQICASEALAQQMFSPDSLDPQNFLADGLEPRNYSTECPENQNISPDVLELRNTSGSAGQRISPAYLEVPQNSPASRRCYPHRSSLRTPRTPQPNEDDMSDECPTFRKPGPEYLSLNSGGGPYVTPSPAGLSVPSYGKFALTLPSGRGRGAPPPISCVGGTPRDNKREALEHLAQLTTTKSCRPNMGGTPREYNREGVAPICQATMTKSGRSWISTTPKQGNRDAMGPCTPSTVTKSAVPRCKRALDFGQAVDFSPCDAQPGPSNRRLPKKPDLSQDEIKELIDSEAEDVECAWLLSTDQKQTYKKPCPKQQKAQMTVKQMVETAQKTKGDTCPKEYAPLLEPEPEDISPEVAAAMMFSQEQGIKLDSCPDHTIRHLFPSESIHRKPPPSKISIVDPNQKENEELIEKSASVPSEGVSDSAYTRTMKQKGGDEIPSQKSYDLDFALGQEKREVVLVPQRPKRFNMLQFRGNSAPWFPGYFSAFPDQSDSIKIVPSPSKLFLKAWIMTNPSNVPASDIIVIE